MIGKIPKSGKSFKGCVEYCVLKPDAHILDANGIRIDTVAHIVNDFNVQRKMRSGLGQAVGHLALCWSPEDVTKLTDELMISIAKEYLQKMGITDTQMLMVKHQDQNHPHLHIVYNRVNNQGNTISDAYQRWKNVKISKALTLEYGFHIGEGKTKVNRQKLKGVDKIKYELHDLIKDLLPKVDSIEELREMLSRQHIEMMYKYKSGTAEVQGVSFRRGKHIFKGSQLDRSLSYSKMLKTIAEGLQVRQGEIKIQKGGSQDKPADHMNDIPKPAYSILEPKMQNLRQQPEINYLQSLPQTNFLGNVLSDLLKPEIDISDDIDDEATYKRRRKHKDQGHFHSR